MLLSAETLPPPKKSWFRILSELPERERDDFLNGLSEHEIKLFNSDFFVNARREQFAPLGDWFIWMIMAGRGFGKTYAGANWIVQGHEHEGEKLSVIVAATASDLRKYCIEGPSGVLAVAPKHFYPVYQPSKTRLVWPNGTETHLYSSEKPNRLRGGNYGRAWCDELSYWKDPEAVWDMLFFTLRYGTHPKCCITMTPRPLALIKQLLQRPDIEIVRGSTLENKDNLATSFVDNVVETYKGTRLERQEVYGELLEDVEGALWNYDLIARNRRTEEEAPKVFDAIRIGVDPSVSAKKTSNKTGIVVVGRCKDKHAWVLGDHTILASPKEWASKVVSVYHSYKSIAKSIRIAAEGNQGGELVKEVIHGVDPSIPVKIVHASVGKVARAEPVVLLYEQNKAHHVGVFTELEEEQCSFVPNEAKESPDRMDACVWAATDLFLLKSGRARTLRKKAA